MSHCIQRRNTAFKFCLSPSLVSFFLSHYAIDTTEYGRGLGLRLLKLLFVCVARFVVVVIVVGGGVVVALTVMHGTLQPVSVHFP